MTLAEMHDQMMRVVATQLDLLRKATGSSYDEDLAAMASNLAKAVASLTAEIRKREAHARKMVGEMTEDERQVLVKAYIASLTKARREEFRKYLEELD